MFKESRVGDFGKVGVGKIWKVGVRVGHFNIDSTTLLFTIGCVLFTTGCVLFTRSCVLFTIRLCAIHHKLCAFHHKLCAFHHKLCVCGISKFMHRKKRDFPVVV